MSQTLSPEKPHINALCRLTLNAADCADAARYVAALDGAGQSEFLSLADSHHVLIRSLTTVQANVADSPAWIQEALAAEHARIQNALRHLNGIVSELEAAKCGVVVMKSLDHWPDLGNDLDLYTTADEQDVVRVMTQCFQAHVEPRSWGDRLAHKWNFAVPGLRESVEVHAKRLGQTGEHIAMARRFVSRRVRKQIAGYSFPMPAPEERIIVATLQRMYRHFYFRVCDIVNSAALVETGALDYPELRRAANLGGIWPGVATYLQIVSDYVRQFRGRGLELPGIIEDAARFGGSAVHVRGKFLRVPIMPHGAGLYTSQVTDAALRGDVPATFRLSLLPPLASAAALAYKITGSDKGIW